MLFFILAFANAAGLFILLGAEFLAMILVIVYVGAVAVLFLFVVMMLDVDFVQLRRGVVDYLPVGSVIGIIILVELVLVVGTWAVGPTAGQAIAAPIPPLDMASNTEALGQVLYTRYVYFFEAARARPAGLDDRRHRIDLAAQAGSQAPEHQCPGGAHPRGCNRDPQGAPGRRDMIVLPKRHRVMSTAQGCRLVHMERKEPE